MELDEIRAEIERRKKRAADLKIRETMWSLCHFALKNCVDNMKADPEMVVPEIRDSLRMLGKNYSLKMDDAQYLFSYSEGKSESERLGRGYDECTTPYQMALEIDGRLVFEFEMTETVTHTPDMPLFHESMGNISAFIEGQWIDRIRELLAHIRSHAERLTRERNAPRLEQKLREDMKKFGLE